MQANAVFESSYAIFDMDGTLTDSMPMWRGAPAAMLARRGITAAPDLGARLNTLSWEEGRALLCREYGLSLTLEQILEEMSRAVAEGYEQVALKPGAAQMLERMAARGVRMCVLSATELPLVERVLHRLGVAERFAFLESCHGMGPGKADPAVYREAMQRLGCAAPAECAVFEDAFYALKTAALGGFAAYAVQDSTGPSPAEAAPYCRRYITDWDTFLK